tara:strand:- start:250 stop:696 length:447 start_codon:yes stop_codon:yes gene_type:complete
MLIATKGNKLDISSEKKTEEVAIQLKSNLKKGDVLFLYGEVGVGKTTFAKYLINEFQKNNNEELTEVISPTFNIINEYVVGNLTIKHYDLFRLKSYKEIKNLNLFDNKKKSIFIVEWPQKIEKNPDQTLKLSFEYDNNYQNRYIKIID